MLYVLVPVLLIIALVAGHLAVRGRRGLVQRDDGNYYGPWYVWTMYLGGIIATLCSFTGIAIVILLEVVPQ